MKYKRSIAKKKSHFIYIIEDHINKNIKEYFISILIFIVGVVIGVLLINYSNEETKESISGYINEFVVSIKNKEYEIDSKKLFFKSLFNNLKFAVIIWVAGSSVIGIPLIYSTIGYKGICLGYSISAIIGALNQPRGIAFAVSSLLAQNIIAIPCMLALSVSSIKMYKAIIKNKERANIKMEVYRHAMFSLMMTIGLVMSTVVEVFISTNVTNSIIKNFI